VNPSYSRRAELVYTRAPAKKVRKSVAVLMPSPPPPLTTNSALCFSLGYCGLVNSLPVPVAYV
jgi:hypothetical protein